MGQPITVTRKQSTRAGTVRFETNRTLTGMGHERYTSSEHAAGARPADEVARRFFAHPGVGAVHIYSNQIYVELASGSNADELATELEQLFIHYQPGVAPSYPPPGDEQSTEPAGQAGAQGDERVEEKPAGTEAAS